MVKERHPIRTISLLNIEASPELQVECLFGGDAECTPVAARDVREMGGIGSPCVVLKCCDAF